MRVDGRRRVRRGRREPGAARPGRLAGRDRGQALVEAAIAIPILLAVLIGIFEFARLWNAKQVITNAAREGARVAILRSSTAAQVQNVVDAKVGSANLDPADITLYLGIRTTSGTPDTVRVTYTYQYQFLGGAIRLISGGAWDGSVQLEAESVMRNE